jgi:septum formation protein
MDRIILASKSPRRRQILAQLRIPFLVFSEEMDENRFSGQRRRVRSLVMLISRRKAQAAATHFSSGLVLAADTVVSFNRRVLGQPENPDEASKYLRMLSGNTHQVFSGITVMNAADGTEYSSFSCTSVRFRRLSEKQISSYIEGKEWSGKAGAYAIQGEAALFVEGIIGSFYNVMGLPVEELYRLLSRYDYFSSDGKFCPIRRV